MSMKKYFAPLKTFGEPFRPREYADPEESWIRVGIFFLCVLLFIGGTVGVFVYKFTHVGAVSRRMASPMYADLKDLLAKEKNDEITQLQCSCKTTQTMQELDVDLSYDDWAIITDGCYNKTEETYDYANFCIGMWNNIGEVWRSQSVGTTALLREGDFHDTVSGIYSTSCKNAIYNMRWQAINLWLYFMNVPLSVDCPPVEGYTTNYTTCDGWNNPDDTFSDAVDYFDYITNLFADEGWCKLSTFPSTPVDKFYSNYVKGCEASACTWLETQQPIDTIMQSVAILSPIYSICMVGGALVYNVVSRRVYQWHKREDTPRSPRKFLFAENDK